MLQTELSRFFCFEAISKGVSRIFHWGGANILCSYFVLFYGRTISTLCVFFTVYAVDH